ncbi:MAG TPA: ribonuclease HII [Anaerolineae bacterium]|jgi:ribonuclease HII|nr:ribonuclease HII [Anaerolineae bacterium]
MGGSENMPETPGLHLEQALWAQGYKFIGGMDEAGRGAWAGPVLAGLVILPADPGIRLTLAGVRDSKKMTALQRSRAAPAIKSVALAWSVGTASSAEIDEIGILPATRLAFSRAIKNANILPEYLLMDYIHWPGLKNPHQMMPRGESQSLSIAAASVLAKTTRDQMMVMLDGQYPGYSLARHKGYGTAIHAEALRQLGTCDIHRKSWLIGH